MAKEIAGVKVPNDTVKLATQNADNCLAEADVIGVIFPVGYAVEFPGRPKDQAAICSELKKRIPALGEDKDQMIPILGLPAEDILRHKINLLMCLCQECQYNRNQSKLSWVDPEMSPQVAIDTYLTTKPGGKIVIR
jgi:hypothetical protein